MEDEGQKSCYNDASGHVRRRKRITLEDEGQKKSYNNDHGYARQNKEKNIEWWRPKEMLKWCKRTC